MKRQFSITALTAFAIFALFSSLLAMPATTADGVATPVSGIGYYAEPGACTDAEGQGSSYVLTMTGDFSGCHNVFLENSICSHGAAYYES